MKITNYKAIGKNTLIGAFDLELPSGICLYGVMLMTNEKGSWVNFPGIPYERDGKTQYKPVVNIPERDRRDAFNTMTLTALRESGVRV